MIELICGNCLDKMKDIPDKSIDMILCDLPYGMTAPKWDSIIPMSELWKEYKRLIKQDCVMAFTASQPFTTMLIHSNLSEFKYCWYWIKNQGTNFFHAKRMPIRKVEEIVIFGGSKYFPQKTTGHKPTNSAFGSSNGKAYHGKNKRNYVGGSTERFPTNVLNFNCVDNYSRKHSSEKPVELFEYLIKTYSNEGDIVLDNAMGSGTTGVACKNLNRNFIGIELDESYFKIAQNRIGEK
jgi:site-specific DNA-methyltransferase (adenine-specific)